MIKILLISVLFPILAFSEVTYDSTFKRGGLQTSKKTLSGVGFTIVSKIKVEESKNEATGVAERKITTSFQNCKNIELGNDEKSSKLKDGDFIRFKMNNSYSCSIGGWEKIN